MRATLVLLVLLPLLLVGLTAIPPPAAAAPVFFEEDFRGCADGTSPPPGWTRSGSTTALIDECSDVEFFPNVVNGTLPGLGPIDGPNSFRIQRADFTCCPIGSHTASFSPVTSEQFVSFGFAFRYANLGLIFLGLSDGCDQGLIIRINEAFLDGPGICADSDRTTPTLDSLFTRDVQFGNWVDTGIDLVEDTWYLFRFDIDRGTPKTYNAFLNDTLIASGRKAGSDVDFNTVTITTRGGRVDVSDGSDLPHFGAQTEVFVDWFFIDEVTVDPIPDQAVSLCGAAAEQTILDASTDATTDVVFGLTSPPSFLSIVPQTGRLFFNLLPPEGPPPVGPTFAVNLTANVSTGGDSELFDLTFEECDPLSWIREFGPAWVIFLAVVAVVVIILLTLWRGAKGRPRRR